MSGSTDLRSIFSYLTDSWSDVEKHYPGDTWNEPSPGPHIYGCLKQFALLKRKNRNLKTLLSIGGWTYSSNFAPAASEPAKRKHFAKTAVCILKDCGFDGLDIDWEYPQSEAEARDLVELLKVTREALDEYSTAQRLGKDAFLLTVACPAGAQNYLKMKIGEMDKYLDFWNLMAYDYAGSWDQKAGHQANVFPSTDNQESTPFSTSVAVEHYEKQGVQRDKIVIGCPLYGRAFCGTAGPGQPYFDGVGEGSWERGIWDWKVLPRDGCKVEEDETLLASWSWHEGSRTMVSFDSPWIVRAKSAWVVKSGLGGVMWWESSGDRKVGDGSAIESVEATLRPNLERKQNVIHYPESKYQNVRDGF